jgi:hypothetical protein
VRLRHVRIALKDANDVALQRVRRGRRYLTNYERSEVICLVICDRSNRTEEHQYSLVLPTECTYDILFTYAI